METKKLSDDSLLSGVNGNMWMDNSMIIMPPEVVMMDESCKKDKNAYNTTINQPVILQSVEVLYPPVRTIEYQKTNQIMGHNMMDTIKKSDEETVSCTWCKTDFQDKNNLLDHIKQKHRVNRMHPCPDCSKVFTQKSNLKAHHRLHTGEKPFKCSFCTKMFAQKSNLINHLSVHTRDKPFECPICKRAFSQRSNLKSHIFTHTGEKPYKCNLCNKEFVQKSNLVSHVRTHTSEKPHHCNICDKYFSQRSNLVSHLKLHARVNT